MNILPTRSNVIKWDAYRDCTKQVKSRAVSASDCQGGADTLSEEEGEG